MLKTPFTRLLLALICAGSLSQASAQESTPKNRWGVRADLLANNGYSTWLAAFGVEYKLPKHNFHAAVTTSPFDKLVESPIMGGLLSYQYYPFRERKCFNLYAFSSVNAGKSTHIQDESWSAVLQEDGMLTPAIYTEKHLYLNGVLGAGFETRFGRHFYANLSLGLNVGYEDHKRSFVYRQETSYKTPSDLQSGNTRIGPEIKAGAGFRF